MSELEEAIKLFGREDLLGGYGIQDTDTNIEVFMSIKDMVKYYRQDLEIERLNNIIKEVRECINHYAIEDEDYSKIYNDEEKTILEILDKVEGDNRNE